MGVNNSRVQSSLPAIASVPNPGDFPLGSIESRAAAGSMLTDRERVGKNLHFCFEYIGFPECEMHFILREDGSLKKWGRRPTWEELAAHPALQDCNFDALRGKT